MLKLASKFAGSTRASGLEEMTVSMLLGEEGQQKEELEKMVDWIAEDLGVITPAVDALRKRHNIPGMVVLQFDVADEDFDLLSVPPDSVCYTGTHDNDTTVGWFHGSPGDIRTDLEIKQTQRAALQVTGGMAETIHTDMIRAAFSTDARLAIAPLQDYLGLGSEARFNVPGTSSNNWPHTPKKAGIRCSSSMKPT